MEYLATFFTHYGAVSFHRQCKKSGVRSKMSPVPRELSASCGVCVYFVADSAPDADSHEDIERCYIVTGDGGFVPAGE